MESNKLPLLILLFTSGFLLSTAQSRTGDYGPVMGIHLGTTYSSVGVFRNLSDESLDNYVSCRDGLYNYPRDPCVQWSIFDAVEIIKNEHGHTTTPSCVAFTDTGVLIGQDAKDQAFLNPEGTICEVMRLVGKKFDDPEVQTLVKSLPYRVMDRENKPHIVLKLKNGESKSFSPEEICGIILAKMKEIAEAYAGIQIKAAIVVFPAHIDTNLRKYIEDPGKIAGLHIYRVVRSSQVAFTAFFDRTLKNQKDKKYLIYDLGGSSFVASMLSLDDDFGVYTVLASRGDPHLGGESFDSRLTNHFVDLIKTKYNKDITRDENALGRLRSECEKAKRSLSSENKVTIKIESLTDGIELFEESMTRSEFEQMNMDLFNKTRDLVRRVIRDVGINKAELELNEIVLVGGSTRIPKIQLMLKELHGKEPLKSVNPEEVDAYVATFIGSYFTYPKPNPPEYLYVVNEMSVGIETIGGVMTTFVGRKARLPKKISHNVTTYQDGQTTIEIKVYEGERELTRHNHYLNRLELSGLVPASHRGNATVEVSIEVDINLNIQVTAKENFSKQKKSLRIRAWDRCCLSMEVMDKGFWKFWDEDAMEKARIEAAIRQYYPQSYNMSFVVGTVRQN